MSQRSKLVVFSVIAAAVGSLMTERPAAGDRAVAPSVNLFPRVYPAWSHWYGIATWPAEVQVIPPGTSGILHSFITSGGALEIHEGPLGNVTPSIVRWLQAAQTQTILDVRFTDGIKITGINAPTEVSILYSLDQPTGYDTGPQ